MRFTRKCAAFATFFFLKREEIKEILGIPPQIFMECAIFLGYGDEQLGKPRRLPVPRVSHANRWGTPYVLAAGNHDYDGTPGRLTLMNDSFPVASLRQSQPGFVETLQPGHLENHCQRLTIQGRDWLGLSLQMGPRPHVIA